MEAVKSCTICDHKDRSAIDAALAAGERVHTVAARFDVNRTAVRRHRARHLPRDRREDATTGFETAGFVLIALEGMLRRARACEAEAYRAGDRRGALAALKEQRAILGLVTQLDPKAGERQRPEPKTVYIAQWGRPFPPVPTPEGAGSEEDPKGPRPPLGGHAE